MIRGEVFPSPQGEGRFHLILVPRVLSVGKSSHVFLVRVGQHKNNKAVLILAFLCVRLIADGLNALGGTEI